MNLKHIALISSLSLISASAAFAEATVVPDNSGFFIAGSIGNAQGPANVRIDTTRYNVNSSLGNAFVPLHNEGYFGALGELGYNWSEYMGVELYGAYLGQQKRLAPVATSIPLTLTSWTFGGNLLAYLPFADHKADLFGKLGIGGMWTSAKTTASSITLSTGLTNTNGKISTTQPIYDFGAGVQYYYTDCVTFRASWDQFARWNTKGGIANLRYNLWTLGADYHFTI